MAAYVESYLETLSMESPTKTISVKPKMIFPSNNLPS